ncbi:DNA translocase FtsK [Rhodovulum imhoffii]|uniref:DNA translocase FtsK n=1 Tax=Rhodovulum imhoffii TaxID=365340 RepID=A0A2T5BV32_9RHOB|nr:DNA translocase FtsK [Rhodovulum imhoffii]MBK5934692.1 cell division protein FtsK [Rhodovulum imhoffii]PTN03332.1 DNA translocase FtsK [Rhodovulum imhoffii]
MASYQIKQRDPLFDSNFQAVLERRSKELLGLALMVLSVILAMILGSYVPDDPGWLSATDAPAQNMLGRGGASVAAALTIVLGWGSWILPLLAVGWGLRLIFHRSDDRVLGRMAFVPFAVLSASIYASTHVPPESWTQSFGVGGLFGDTVLGAVLGLLPLSPVFGLKAVSVLTALATVALALLAMGVDRAEMKAFGRFLLVGAVMSYVGLLSLFRHGAGAVLDRARAVRVRTAAAPAEESAARLRAGLLSRVPRRGLSAPEPGPELMPELVESDLAEDRELDPPSEDRIKARIADVIKARARKPGPQLAALRPEPPLRRGRGPQPLIADPLPPQPRLMPDPDPVFEDFEDEGDDASLRDLPARSARPVPEAPRVVVKPHGRPVQQSRRAQAEAQPDLKFEEAEQAYDHPPLSLLTNPTQVERHYLSDEALAENARMLENVLDDYGVKGEIVSVRPGPVVTMYELEPAPGLKASRVIGLADDIARSMSALAARVSTLPGRSVIGIELPNANREMVVLREILAARDFGDTNMRLPLALGKDIGGAPVVANLAKMPHLLIAGTTGSGKSVAINTMILSLLYKLTPDECRLIMIDPKMLELSVYDGIPHLLSPVVTDPKKAVVALKWVVAEMEDRYRKMSKMGVRNIEGYNGRVRDALAKAEMFSRTVQTGFDDETGEPVFETEEFSPEVLPYIVVIVDEMADLMMVAGKEIEACIQRLAQMARASGIHLIMATQRPSVDVITGTIKANFPTRISFQVTSKVDSRTILGEQGAEQLLGMGDMLYMAGGGKITRVHGPFVSDEEVEEIVSFLKQYGPPDYVGGVVEGPEGDKENDIDLVLGLGGNTDSEDALYDQAVAIVLKDRKCSTSYIQRKLAIGYNKAARLVEQMEEQGVVSPANHVGKREILVPEQA